MAPAHCKSGPKWRKKGRVEAMSKVRRVVRNDSDAHVKVATMAGVVLRFQGGVSQAVELEPGWTGFYYYASGEAGARVRLSSLGTDLNVDRQVADTKSIHKAFKFRVYGDPK